MQEDGNASDTFVRAQAHTVCFGEKHWTIRQKTRIFVAHFRTSDTVRGKKKNEQETIHA